MLVNAMVPWGVFPAPAGALGFVGKIKQGRRCLVMGAQCYLAEKGWGKIEGLQDPAR